MATQTTRRKRRSPSASSTAFDPLSPRGPDDAYARHLALRVLDDDARFRAFFRNVIQDDDHYGPRGIDPRHNAVLNWLDLFGKATPETVDPAQLRSIIRDAARALPAQAPASRVRQAVDWLGGVTGLDQADCALLELGVMARTINPLLRLLDGLGIKTQREDADLFAALFGLPRAAMLVALGKRGNLHRYGFLRYDHFYDSFPSRLEMPADLLGVLSAEYADREQLVAAFLNPLDEPELTRADVPHLAAHLDTLGAVLPNALAQRRRGINVLFHGDPGTGKSQLAALVARECGLPGYQVRKPDEEADAQSGPERLGYLHVVQQMLGNGRPAMLVFDEFEDVVPDSDLFGGFFSRRHRKSAPMKSWLTRTLEDNPVPTIWICNATHHIDAALLRRFTYVAEFRTPPSSVRARILGQALDGVPVRPAWIARMATVNNLSPALMRNAATVAALAGTTDAAATEALLERTLQASMNVCGHRLERNGMVTATRYDLSFLNTTVAPDRVLDAVARTGRGTLCFYGPPGTGKSALAGHLATQLDRPLMVRRASDLLSMWVGQTEQLIARMFEEARDENAVLLIDEADSFLASRADAVRSWEVTQVNEMLSQIEHFEGLLICTTNRLDHMDPATLRRFVHKVGFNYLQPAQRNAMFFSEFGNWFAPQAHAAAVAAALDGLSNLAPGDFATVRRRFDASGQDLALDEVLQALRSECELKPDRQRQRVGFV
jgi:SpoVK/Ycf46/Vps4 family AAA+-type ATPase